MDGPGSIMNYRAEAAVAANSPWRLTMNTRHLPQTVLLVLGIIALVKSVWGLAHPSSLKRVGVWWSKAAMQVNTLFGWACISIAVGLLVAVLFDQPLTNWLVVMLGALCAWAGIVYLRPDDLQKLLKTAILDRGLGMIRVTSFISAIIAILLIWVAVKGI